MKAILLKRKPEAPFTVTDKAVVDDIVTGLIDNGFYIPVINTAEPGLTFYSVDTLIDNFLWPIQSNVPQSRIESFLRGHNPNLASTIEHYSVDETKDRQ